MNNSDPKDLPGLNAAELASLGPCAVCGKKLGESGDITHYGLTIERFCMIPQAVKRAAGLELAIGALASVMGPNEDLAKVVDGPKTVLIHESCSNSIMLLELLEDADG